MSTPRPGWIGPCRLPETLTRSLLTGATNLSDRLGPWPVWLLVGALAGTLPLLGGGLGGLRLCHLASGLCLMPLLVAGVVRDSEWHGLGAVATGFLAHGAAVIALTATWPDLTAAWFPSGMDYWEQSRDWILTGASQEYDIHWWLPAHAQLLAAMLLFGYLSLGLVPFWQGFHEVDLMNCYVGHLLRSSHSPGIALALGWHPWSVCRGVGYLVLTFEIVSYSFQRLTGEPLSSRSRRRRRWAVGLSFLLLDCLLKYLLLDRVRQTLAGNLIDS